MKAQLSKIIQRIKSLGLCKNKQFAPLFPDFGFRDDDEPQAPRCTYWNQDRLQAQCDKMPNFNNVVETGCPLIPEREWSCMGMGEAGVIRGDDCEIIETFEPTPAPDCKECEHYGTGTGYGSGIYIKH